ncbi:MAG: hypothetical protein Q7U04_01185 [Bacteriovorax sp.]|nr:hypothetical protein [Bacteriovorax sp.]
MKCVIALTVCLLSFNSFAESINAKCRLNSIDKDGHSEMHAATFKALEKNDSFQVGTMAGYSFEVKNQDDGIKTIVVDLKTGATITSLSDAGSLSAILVKVEDTEYVLHCDLKR